MLGQIDGFGAFSIADWWPFRALLLGGAAVCVLAALRWGRGVMQRTTDQWAKAHDEVAPVLVVPDINGSLLADTECVDSSRGNAETYLTVDLPSFVTKRFETDPPGPRWTVAGPSEGGSCSIMLALRHSGVFGTLGDHSGLIGPRDGKLNDDTVSALFGGSGRTAFWAHEPVDLLRSRQYPQLGGWFQVGTADAEPLAATKVLAPAAEAAGIAMTAPCAPGS